MSSAGRWTIVVFILGIAGIVALWPRSEPDVASNTPLGADASGFAPSAEPLGDHAALAPLRKDAALQPCPTPAADAPEPAGPLAGVEVPCLGEPGTVDLGAALAGETTLLNVWASWCPICREEMPALDEYAKRPNAISVLGVNVRDRATSALEMAAEADAHFPSVYDEAEAVQRALRMPPVVPLNYLVHPDGTVERITDPLVFRSPEEVHAAIERHLRSKR